MSISLKWKAVVGLSGEPGHRCSRTKVTMGGSQWQNKILFEWWLPKWKLKFDLWEGHILNIKLLFHIINFYTWVKIRGVRTVYSTTWEEKTRKATNPVSQIHSTPFGRHRRHDWPGHAFWIGTGSLWLEEACSRLLCSRPMMMLMKNQRKLGLPYLLLQSPDLVFRLLFRTRKIQSRKHCESHGPM